MSFDQTDRSAFRVVRRGYDRVQVDRYVGSLEEDVETWRSRVEELESTRERAKVAPGDPSSQARHAAVSDHAAQVMRALDDEVERLRARADKEVERRLSEARADADRIRADAESKSNEVGRLANDGLSDLKDRRRSLYGKLRRIRNAIDGALSELDPEIDEEWPADNEVLLLEDDGSDERVDQ